jgi:hypothetical protein
MNPADRLATEILGPDAEALEFKLGRSKHRGWRCNFGEDRQADAAKLVTQCWRRAHDGGLQLFVGAAQFMLGAGRYSDSWGEVSFNPADGPPAMPDPRQAPPTVLPVYALPGLDAMQVIQFADVGSHNAVIRGLGAELMKLPPDADRRQLTEDFFSRLHKRHKHRKPWQEVQDGLRKIMARAPFVITFADPAGLKARFLNLLDDDQALAAAEIIFQLSPEAYDCGPEEIAQRIANREQFKLWWD